MTEAQLVQLCLKQLNLRLEPEMARYVLRTLSRRAEPDATDVPVMAGEARTGVPLRAAIPAALLAASSPT